MRYVAIATEDELSEAICHRLLSDVGGGLSVALKLRRNGFGYLRSSMRKFCELARQMPVFLLTDLDTSECPATLVEEWSRKNVVPDQLIFRVAVRQVESWLLADRASIARLLNVSARQVPGNPDTLPDAKQSLLKLASGAPRRVRDRLLAEKGATARQGLGYNAVLVDYVRSHWSPAQASVCSNSLHRARVRLSSLATRR